MTRLPKVPPDSPDEIEQQFYDAMRRADIERLMAAWSDDDEIVCVHPGGPRIVGPAQVRASFETIFANGPVDARVEAVRRVSGGDCAVHSVLERVRVMSRQGPQDAWVVATNVYLRTPMGWRMVVHHASPGTLGEQVPETVEPSPSVLH